MIHLDPSTAFCYRNRAGKPRLLMQVMLDGLLAGNNEVSVAALCIMWPLCCHMQSQSLRKVVVSHLRHAQRLPDVASRVAGVQVHPPIATRHPSVHPCTHPAMSHLD